MRKLFILPSLAVMAAITAGCSRDMEFSSGITDADARANAEMRLGVEIDPNQDWVMTKTVKANVAVNLGTGSEYTLYVFDKSPFTDDNVVYYAKKTVTDGSNVSLDLTLPKAQNMTYVTLIDSDGRSLSKYTAVADDALDVVFNGNAAKAPARAMTRTNSGDNYPATHGGNDGGANMNHNEWADPNTQYGGWVVPAPLTDQQKAVVTAYFQNNPNPGYQDPEWRHFFVQQVYKGGKNTVGGTTEGIIAANNSSYDSGNMNLMTVSPTHIHINNFNAGDCSSSNVLDNGQTVNGGTSHSDKITLMVNIDDTSCFGYHETGSSTHHDNKAGLVDWETIRTWANANNLNGNCLNDGWNRSFLGYDLALQEGEQAYAGKEAKISDVPGNMPQYVWDGTNVIPVGEENPVVETGDKSIIDEFYTWGGSYSNHVFGDEWNGGTLVKQFGGADWSNYEKLVIEFEEGTPRDLSFVIATSNNAGNIVETTIPAGTTSVEYSFAGKTVDHVGDVKFSFSGGKAYFHFKTIKLVALPNSAPEPEPEPTDEGETFGRIIKFGETNLQLLSTNTNQYKGEMTRLNDGDMKIQKQYNGQNVECLNLPAFKSLYDQGYLPVNDKNLREWVKLGTSDGYYSDWIVTLTKAKRIGEVEIHVDTIDNVTRPIYSYAFEDTKMGDYDMNDVVLQVQESEDGQSITVTLVAAGGTLDCYIYVNGEKIEEEVHDLFGVNRGQMVNTNAGPVREPVLVTTILNTNGQYDPANLDIKIQATGQDMMSVGRTPGDLPYGVIIPVDWKWPLERVCIKDAYNGEAAQAAGATFTDFAEDVTNTAAQQWYKHPAVEGTLYE